MSLVLDAATEDRIQRQLDRGPYTAPAELINHALDLLEAERNHLAAIPPDAAEEWLLRNREAIDEALEHSMAQAARGETYSGDQALRMLEERRINRAA